MRWMRVRWEEMEGRGSWCGGVGDLLLMSCEASVEWPCI